MSRQLDYYAATITLSSFVVLPLCYVCNISTFSWTASIGVMVATLLINYYLPFQATRNILMDKKMWDENEILGQYMDPHVVNIIKYTIRLCGFGLTILLVYLQQDCLDTVWVTWFMSTPLHVFFHTFVDIHCERSVLESYPTFLLPYVYSMLSWYFVLQKYCIFLMIQVAISLVGCALFLFHFKTLSSTLCWIWLFDMLVIIYHVWTDIQYYIDIRKIE